MDFFVQNFQVFLLVMARVFGMFVVAPFFSSGVIPLRIRAITAVYVAACVFPMVAGSVGGALAGYGLVGAFNTFGPKLFFIPVDPWLPVFAALLATVTGIVSAALPARRAARLDPVEAIRHV